MVVFEFAPKKVHLVIRGKRDDLNTTQNKFFDSMWSKLSQPFDTGADLGKGAGGGVD